MLMYESQTAWYNHKMLTTPGKIIALLARIKLKPYRVVGLKATNR